VEPEVALISRGLTFDNFVVKCAFTGTSGTLAAWLTSSRGYYERRPSVWVDGLLH